MNSKVLRCVFASSAVLILLICLSGCSAKIGDTTLDGINVIWAPLILAWNWFTGNFSPSFWATFNFVWDLPFVLSLIVAVIVYILALVVYLVILAVFLVISLVYIILASIFWIILALLNGIFHIV